mgnify:CR=1 FL=1
MLDGLAGVEEPAKQPFESADSRLDERAAVIGAGSPELPCQVAVEPAVHVLFYWNDGLDAVLFEELVELVDIKTFIGNKDGNDDHEFFHGRFGKLVLSFFVSSGLDGQPFFSARVIYSDGLRCLAWQTAFNAFQVRKRGIDLRKIQAVRCSDKRFFELVRGL